MGLLQVVAILAFLIVVGGIIAYAVSMYNRLVELDEECKEAWNDIDVILKQRNDELPNLVETVQQYTDYEEGVLKEITEARTQVQEASTPAEQADAESALKGALGNIFAVAEDYPELKASDQFQQLQSRVSELEERLADRREFYNERVTTYNTRINQVPFNIIAAFANYSRRQLFEVDEKEKQQVNIADEFNS